MTLCETTTAALMCRITRCVIKHFYEQAVKTALESHACVNGSRSVDVEVTACDSCFGFTLASHTCMCVCHRFLCIVCCIVADVNLNSDDDDDDYDKETLSVTDGEMKYTTSAASFQ